MGDLRAGRRVVDHDLRDALPPDESCPASRRGQGDGFRLRRGAILCGILLLVAFVLDRAFPLPLPDANHGSTVVLARDGSPLRAFADAQGIWSYPVSVDEVSPLYLQALIGYEDRWFWQHPGINPVASMRALGQMIASGRIVSGGSTLTMQVARILEPHPRSIGGKVRQSLRALQLEAHLSKREILELYLAHAPFGGTLQGVEAASWAYLGHSARQLSHAEAALLVVLPQAPSRLRPDRNASDARVARDKVLQRMATLDRGLYELLEMVAFAGLTIAEVAEQRGLSSRSINRDLIKARTLLRALLGEPG